MTKEEKGEANKRRYEEAFALAVQGKLDDIPKDLLTRHYNTYKKIMVDYSANPTGLQHLDNHWIYGPSGSGKSRYVRDNYPDLYVKNQNKWWCGYKGEENVLIDDLHPSWTGIHQLKNWADRYEFRAEIKGADKALIRPKRILITSNYHPEQCNFKPEDIAPIKRRFKITHMYEPFKINKD